MKNVIDYKGYIGSVEFSEADNCLFGEVLGVKSMLTYEGETVSALVEDFHDTVDAYLEMCKSEGIKPEKSYKGSFNVRISPELHKQLAIYALSQSKTLNSLIEEALIEKVHSFAK